MKTTFVLPFATIGGVLRQARGVAKHASERFLINSLIEYHNFIVPYFAREHLRCETGH